MVNVIYKKVIKYKTLVSSKIILCYLKLLKFNYIIESLLSEIGIFGTQIEFFDNYDEKVSFFNKTYAKLICFVQLLGVLKIL